MKVLRIKGLMLLVDAYGEDPKEEAQEVVRVVNRLITKISGDPQVDFDLGHAADIEATYEDDGEIEENANA